MAADHGGRSGSHGRHRQTYRNQKTLDIVFGVLVRLDAGQHHLDVRAGLLSRLQGRAARVPRRGRGPDAAAPAGRAAADDDQLDKIDERREGGCRGPQERRQGQGRASAAIKIILPKKRESHDQRRRPSRPTTTRSTSLYDIAVDEAATAIHQVRGPRCRGKASDVDRAQTS